MNSHRPQKLIQTTLLALLVCVFTTNQARAQLPVTDLIVNIVDEQERAPEHATVYIRKKTVGQPAGKITSWPNQYGWTPKSRDLALAPGRWLIVADFDAYPGRGVTSIVEALVPAKGAPKTMTVNLAMDKNRGRITGEVRVVGPAPFDGTVILIRRDDLVDGKITEKTPHTQSFPLNVGGKTLFAFDHPKPGNYLMALSWGSRCVPCDTTNLVEVEFRGGRMTQDITFEALKDCTTATLIFEAPGGKPVTNHVQVDQRSAFVMNRSDPSSVTLEHSWLVKPGIYGLAFSGAKPGTRVGMSAFTWSKSNKIDNRTRFTIVAGSTESQRVCLAQHVPCRIHIKGLEPELGTYSVEVGWRLRATNSSGHTTIQTINLDADGKSPVVHLPNESFEFRLYLKKTGEKRPSMIQRKDALVAENKTISYWAPKLIDLTIKTQPSARYAIISDVKGIVFKFGKCDTNGEVLIKNVPVGKYQVWAGTVPQKEGFHGLIEESTTMEF